ncbi:MAG: NADH-quinone oxidoreductase subunit M [Myxococcota bacterium]|nr:NADH-quinone oxidoreductase subunit M [Myxococcota bacterium]
MNMTWFEQNLASIVAFVPLLGAICALLIPAEEKGVSRWSAFFFSMLAFVMSLWMFAAYRDYSSSMAFEVRKEWIPAFGVSYHVGVDGISLLLVMLTTFLTPIVVLSTFRAVDEKVNLYMFCMLFLEACMLGSLIALDVFLFYVFWELMLIPMFILIGVFGGDNRIYATIKFFLFTFAGSLLMLVAILYAYLHSTDPLTGGHSTSIYHLVNLNISPNAQMLCFLAFSLAFAIKVPMFPFHTWLPDAHVQAPTGGSVILAGVLLKLGVYGFMRFAIPMFPAAAMKFMPVIAALSVVGVIYGALVAMVQNDIKKLVAYSSVSHLGFVMLGLAAMTVTGVTGALYQSINHGVSTGALFLIVGIIYERAHTREIAHFGGLAKLLPFFAAVFLVVTLSSIALPVTNGFIGEFMILIGTFASGTLKHAKIMTALASTGVVLGAVYMLWMYQRVMLGPVTNEENRGLEDMNLREMLYMAPVIAMIFIMGLFPEPFLRKVEPSVNKFVNQVTSRAKEVEEANARWNEEHGVKTAKAPEDGNH